MSEELELPFQVILDAVTKGITIEKACECVLNESGDPDSFGMSPSEVIKMNRRLSLQSLVMSDAVHHAVNVMAHGRPEDRDEDGNPTVSGEPEEFVFEMMARSVVGMVRVDTFDVKNIVNHIVDEIIAADEARKS